MRNVIFCLMAIAIAATSCGKFEEVDFGYPESVTLSSEGGEKIITSEEPFRYAVIQNYKIGDESSIIGTEDERYREDVEQRELEWLRIEYGSSSHNKELKIFAKPNTSGKPRTLHLELYLAYEYQVVKVTQN